MDIEGVKHMWKRLECVAIYTEDIDSSIEFYKLLGMIKVWDTFQDEEQKWRLVGLKFPNGESELVLKNNPNLNFSETEVLVEDVIQTYELLKDNPSVQWIRTPFPNSLGGHVAVMKSPDHNVFVLVGK